MKVFVETTRFINDLQIDINYLQLQLAKNPLVIATREGQIGRINKWLKANNHTAKVIGWWNMQGDTVTTLDEFDSVFFLDPERASCKKEYKALISLVQELYSCGQL